MANILGISCFYHDSAACLIKDNEVMSAAQEERFTRIKHDKSFPTNAINYCLDHAGIGINDIDIIAFYEDSELKWDRIKQTGKKFKLYSDWWFGKRNIKKVIRKTLDYKGTIVNFNHHASHAGSAFLTSPFEEAKILTMDGVGEWDTATIGYGFQGKISNLKQVMKFPNSIGLFYSAFTYFLGFKVNSGEYKVMGLAPYGEPCYKEIIESIIIKDGGLNQEYFDYVSGNTMLNKKFYKLFGDRREPETELTQRHFNMAASIQAVTEDWILKLANKAYRDGIETKNLCMAGGVALNCLANSRILKESKFENVWIQPAAGDAGGALGCAMLAAGLKKYFRKYYLGPEYDDEYIRMFLTPKKKNWIKYFKSNRAGIIAKHLADGKIIGLFQGRMEFGPRALGNRSILADPRPKDMQDRINKAVKIREAFRPFAPSVLADKMNDYFDTELKESPYMLFTADALYPEDIPAVIHVNNTSRLHTVTREDNPRYYDIIKEFENLTGIPMVLNTSFNVRGEPIVCSPEDAYKCFMNTGIDILVLEDYIIYKEEI